MEKITKEFLISKGFSEPGEFECIYSLEISNEDIECVFQSDFISLEVDLEDQIMHFFYVTDNDEMFKADVPHLFFLNINTDQKLNEFINLITKHKYNDRARSKTISRSQNNTKI